MEPGIVHQAIKWPEVPAIGMGPINLHPPQWTHEDRYSGQAVLPHMFIGPYHLVRNLEFIQQHGIEYVLCIRDPSERLFLRETALPGVEFCFLDVPADVNKTSIIPHFGQANQLIRQITGQGKTILLCCSDGIDKSASFLTAYLMNTYSLAAVDAITFVQNRRYCATPSPYGYRLKLMEYELICSAEKSSAAQQLSPGGGGSGDPKCSRRREDDDENMGEDQGSESRTIATAFSCKRAR
ncbi:hypothetical protein GGI04_000834 [Coemansia thaxteri]|uniref:Uncharacterized protein n=1 Tax=Coemansia thaxteri TaxID=2663907 RepID=A0A9W8EKE4_9FUNG|nr:hypothetical protein H4R26_002169 [Coemansia thaxteri]KAJ2008961.1 hypothetical protein GGI04_000834 [Coemansia thaxteri]KAJ2473590.1 hypothetical protein GGI02_000740 [Coemansia sp. RSA 2322]KAJ2485878.1 hypothetical protein EV174_001452 [Coemansia sp. RSA 2320]